MRCPHCCTARTLATPMEYSASWRGSRLSLGALEGLLVLVPVVTAAPRLWRWTWRTSAATSRGALLLR